MATTLVLVGGLVVAATAVGVRQLISIAPLVTTAITPEGWASEQSPSRRILAEAHEEPGSFGHG